MIICHPLKIIFFKTKKTGGTSFEIALSEFCGPECVITPISPADENLRAELGLRCAQNYDAPTWPDGSQNDGVFFNHITAREARANIPDEIWNSYQKVTIVRDPFDAAISRYYWEGGGKTGLGFGKFIDIFRSFLSENSMIAPLDGPLKMDRFIRYEHLEQDIRALGVEGLFDRFSTIRAKASHRPKTGASKFDFFEENPTAAHIVAEECQDVLNRFGYPKPTPKRPSRGAEPEPCIFTITAGRTATAWLKQFLGDNMGIPAVHEPLRPEDFGTKMPDIRTMRSFNNYGMARHVRAFWNTKFDSISGPYAETNHTLAKCGLIEALAESDMAKRTTLIVLRRNLADQCVSYIMRGDFANATIEWQWYLSPNYRNVMVNPEQFLPLGPIGRALWYCFEMETRQAFYLQKYQHTLNFVEAKLEDIIHPKGAKALLSSLGYNGPVSLPQKLNANVVDDVAKTTLKQEVEQTIRNLEFDPISIAQSYIEKGRSLSLPVG